MFLSLVNFLEFFSTLLSFFALYLKIKKIKRTWLVHGVRKVLSFFVYFQGQLYTKCVLDIVFIFTSLYGWFSWNKKSSLTRVSHSLPKKKIILLIAIAFFFSPLLGYYQANYTTTKFPYTTALHGFFVLYAYILLARKNQIGWMFWILSNFLYVVVCWYLGKYFFFVKYCIYTVVACKGYWEWRKEYVTS